jgi:phage protein U
MSGLMPVRLLITSVGSLVGQNVLEALAHLRHEFHIVGLNSQSDAVSNFLCDRVYRTPPLADESAFSLRLDDVLAAESPDLVIPWRDDDVVFLAQWCTARHTDRPLVMVGSPVMARIIRDKVLSCRFAERHHLPFVPTVGLGEFRFEIATAAYQKFSLNQSWRWPEQARINRDPALQFVGRNVGEIELDGVIYPSFKGGLGQIEAMRALADAGKPQQLVDGLGRIWGGAG